MSKNELSYDQLTKVSGGTGETEYYDKLPFTPNGVTWREMRAPIYCPKCKTNQTVKGCLVVKRENGSTSESYYYYQEKAWFKCQNGDLHYFGVDKTTANTYRWK